jgi:hypothetical protein
MITNLGFDLSGLGGSNPEYFASPAALVTRLNTLTGATWTYNATTCKFESINYPGAPPAIDTRYRVDFIDADADSTGFCNAGALDFNAFKTIDLTAYGGSAFTAVTSNADIVTAFAALTPSLTVAVSGCQLEILNWNIGATPSNIEVNNVKIADIEDGSGNDLTCADY